MWDERKGQIRPSEDRALERRVMEEEGELAMWEFTMGIREKAISVEGNEQGWEHDRTSG